MRWLFPTAFVAFAAPAAAQEDLFEPPQRPELPLVAEHSLQLFPTDFDSDGDLDLIAAQRGEDLLWFRNDGGRTEPRFVDPERLLAEGSPISVPVH